MHSAHMRKLTAVQRLTMESARLWSLIVFRRWSMRALGSSAGVDFGEFAQQSYSTTIVGGGPVVIARRVHRGMAVAMSLGFPLVPGLQTQTAVGARILYEHVTCVMFQITA